MTHKMLKFYRSRSKMSDECNIYIYIYIYTERERKTDR